jgi:cephalosporin-C deacetylase-like acetyl esterase
MNSMVTKVLNRNLLLCFYVLSSLPVLNAQLTLTTDRPTANYSVGSTANFIISSTASGTATYKLYYDNKTTPITTGSIPISAGQSSFLPYRHTEAGVVLCSVTQNGVTKMSSVAFSPMDIAPAEAEPTDFDAFWNSQKNLINSVPLAPQVSFYRQGHGFTTYKLSLGNIEGRRVYGYISVPESTSSNTITGPFPAIISLPSFGDAPGVCSPDEMIPQQGKAICVSLSVHNTDPLIQDPNAYKPNNITDKAGFYYRYALLGVVQTINYLFTRPDFNKRDIGIVGTSQGGGLALCAAGLDNRIKLVAMSNPALCEHSAFKLGKASGFPYYLNQARIFNTEALASTAVKYYDAVHFAKRFQGVTYAVVGYQDDVTPAATTFAAIAQLRHKTLVFHAPQMGHAHPEEYWAGRMAFFRKHFPTMALPPLQVTLSHAADAGTDKTIAVGQALPLAGVAELNGLVDNAMSVRWEKISGTGVVTFSDPFNRNTQANFSAAGTYTLRFSATDNRFPNGKVFVAIDYITVTVNNNNPPPPPPPATGYCEARGNQPWHNWIERIENETVGYGSFKDTYGDFTDKVFPVQRGRTSVFQLTPGYAWQAYNLNWRIWIDFNNDNDFSDAGEMVVSTIGISRFSVNVPIPANASLGNKRIRIAMQKDTVPNACGTYESGEVEDYTLNITDAVSASSPPPPSYGSSNNTNYCTAGGVASNVWISSVRFGDSTYNSGKEGYGNFLGKSFTIAKSQAIPLALKPSFSGAPADVFWKVWVDYDRDGHFALSENIWSSQGKDLVNTLMFMPSNLVSGIPYRMRIVMRQGAEAVGYCGIVDAGEIEDYTLFLTGGSSQTTNYTVFKEQIQLYPNPVSEELTIDLNAYGGGQGALRIYDPFGKMVWEMPENRFPSRQIKLDVANFQDGIYFLMTEGAGLRILLDKFVVLKQR